MSTMVVSGSDIERTFDRWGLSGSPAIVHASLSSFGRVEGGAEAVAAALARSLSTVVVPAMNWGPGSAEVGPPPGDRPLHNGMDAEYFGGIPNAPVAFDPHLSGMVRAMGAIPRAVRVLPGAVRSRHPLASWVAFGADARALTDGQGNDDPYYPIRLLRDRNGLVVLLGVTLTSCTAIHLAEQMAGRRPFIRWVCTREGRTTRVLVGGCSDGFDNLLPGLAGALSEGWIGPARILYASLGQLVTRAQELIRRSPEITICGRRCSRCLDAVGGGPTSSEEDTADPAP